MTRRQLNRLKKIQENLKGFKEHQENSEIANRSTKQQCCNGKNSYGSWHTAEKVAKRQSKENKSKIEPYNCPYCHGIHIGHKQNNIELKINSISDLKENATATLSSLGFNGKTYSCSCIYKMVNSKKLFELIILGNSVKISRNKFNMFCR